jgi:hypothetical protein
MSVSVEVEDVETTRSEKALALVLAVFPARATRAASDAARGHAARGAGALRAWRRLPSDGEPAPSRLSLLPALARRRGCSGRARAGGHGRLRPGLHQPRRVRPDRAGGSGSRVHLRGIRGAPALPAKTPSGAPCPPGTVSVLRLPHAGQPVLRGVRASYLQGLRSSDDAATLVYGNDRAAPPQRSRRTEPLRRQSVAGAS